MANQGVAREVVDFLRDAGLNWIRSVRALALATGKGIGYAKPAVFNSDTWADERPRINAMHDEIVASLEQLARDGEHNDELRRDTD